MPFGGGKGRKGGEAKSDEYFDGTRSFERAYPWALSAHSASTALKSFDEEYHGAKSALFVAKTAPSVRRRRPVEQMFAAVLAMMMVRHKKVLHEKLS